MGSNAGDPAANVLRAFDELAALGLVRKRSSLYCTKPWGKTDQADFVNAVALVETHLSPAELLHALKQIESDMGRTPGERWGPRTMDLDLLTYGERRIDEPGLIVPHSQMRERAFVLVPLAEIDDSYAPLRDALDPSDLAGVRKLEPAP